MRNGGAVDIGCDALRTVERAIELARSRRGVTWSAGANGLGRVRQWDAMPASRRDRSATDEKAAVGAPRGRIR